MKKFLAVIITGCISTLALAQQDPQFSQNMFNKLYVNPAYAGSSEAICANLLFRKQWISYDGAPVTGVLGIEAPLLGNKVGAGLSLSSDKIGYQSTITAQLAGAYRFDLAGGKLGLGVDFDYLQHKIDGASLHPSEPTGDPAIPAGTVSGNAFDLGGGLYFNTEKFYVGLSATHLMESKVKLDQFSTDFNRHYYGMIGYSFDVTPTIALKPSIFVKNVKDNTTVDVNMNAHFNNKFWAGLSYRNQDAIVALIGLNLMDNLRLGISYDFTTSEVRKYSDGTAEITLGYCFKVKKKIIPSIRNVRFL